MDLSYGEELEGFREEIREFLDETWPLQGKEAELPNHQQAALFRGRAITRGYLCRNIPQKYGGSEQEPDVLKAQIIREEFGRVFAPGEARGIGTMMLVPTLLERGAKSPISLQTRIDRAMDVALSREMEAIEGRLGFLASVGSAAPFIGLFGTVVGIMTSFQAIAGSESTNLAVVAPGIAEALLATALGLVAAIPAVIGYNKLTSDAAKLSARMEGFADEFSAILSRQIDERSSAGQRAQAAQ